MPPGSWTPALQLDLSAFLRPSAAGALTSIEAATGQNYGLPASTQVAIVANCI